MMKETRVQTQFVDLYISCYLYCIFIEAPHTLWAWFPSRFKLYNNKYCQRLCCQRRLNAFSNPYGWRYCSETFLAGTQLALKLLLAVIYPTTRYMTDLLIQSFFSFSRLPWLEYRRVTQQGGTFLWACLHMGDIHQSWHIPQNSVARNSTEHLICSLWKRFSDITFCNVF